MYFKSSLIKCRLLYCLAGVIISFILIVCVTGSTNCFAGEQSHETIAVGEKAPMFKSFTIDGQPFDLEEKLSQKGIVLFFWSFFCSPCREEMPLMEEFYKNLQDRPVEIAGVNLDEIALHTPIKNYLKSSGFTYPIVVNKYKDNDAKLDKLYMVSGTPTIYMIKQDGTIAYTHVGRLEFDDFKEAVEDSFFKAGM